MPVLQLKLLGRLQLSSGDRPVELSSAKAKALLCYLAVTGRAHSRQALAGLLWGELPEEDARRNLRVVLTRLREQLGPYLVATREHVSFNCALPHTLDVELFERQVREARSGDSVEELQRTTQLYGGEFLDDFTLPDAPPFDEWVLAQRERLHQLALRAIHRLAAQQTADGAYGAAADSARRLLSLDQWREEAHRELMLLLALDGKRSAALAQYETCRRILAEQFEVEPDQETQVLYQRIRDGRVAPTGDASGFQPQRTPGEGLLPAQAPLAEPEQGDLSPFVAGPPISHPSLFFGRERELRRIFGLLRSAPLQNAAIIGPRRSGKTSLLHHLHALTRAQPAGLRPGQRVDWLPQPERYRWAYVDFQDPRLSTRAGLLRSLLTQLRLPLPAVCDLDHFMDVVGGQLRSPAVVLLDEMDVGLQRQEELDDMFWEGMRSLATTQTRGQLAFVLATRGQPHLIAGQAGLGSPFFNIFGYTADLGPLTEDEARELITSAPVPFPEADVEWILAQSGRWPFLLQILCRERLAALEDGEADDRWRDDGLRQLTPFTYLRETT